MLSSFFNVATEAATTGLEPLGAFGQLGVLGGLLITAAWVIRNLFSKMLTSKDNEIAAAKAALDSARADRDRFEAKLDKLQEVIQTQIIAALADASATTRKALELTQKAGSP